MTQLAFTDPTRDPIAALLSDYERWTIERAVEAMGTDDERGAIDRNADANKAVRMHRDGRF